MKKLFSVGAQCALMYTIFLKLNKYANFQIPGEKKKIVGKKAITRFAEVPVRTYSL